MVEIIHFEKADKNKVKGYLDIRIPLLKPAVILLRKVAYINNGNKRYFALPSFTRNGQSEKPKYERYFEFETPAFNTHVLDSLHDRFKDYCEINNIEPDENFTSLAQERFDNEVIPF